MEVCMSVKIETVKERKIVCDLGTVTFHDETGSVRFRIIDRTANPRAVRELSKVLEDVAVMMEAQ
jgi:hypothetical protein